MSSPRASISKILPFSCVDGPGARAVVFLQGCQFRCAICHNPHSQGVCDGCAACVPACPRGALRVCDGLVLFASELCDSCDACLEACPINGNPMARAYSVDEVVAILVQRRALLNGVTVSGGEPTLQFEYVAALFAAIKADPRLAGLTTFVDSNGYLNEAAWRALAPLIDGAMIDVKAFDPALHRLLTGFDNRRPLRSAEVLRALGKLYELRIPLIPGINDTLEELDALAHFALGLGAELRVRLNAFQRHGVKGEAAQWPPMTREAMEAAAARLRGAGLKSVVTPSVYLA